MTVRPHMHAHVYRGGGGCANMHAHVPMHGPAADWFPLPFCKCMGRSACVHHSGQHHHCKSLTYPHLYLPCVPPCFHLPCTLFSPCAHLVCTFCPPAPVPHSRPSAGGPVYPPIQPAGRHSPSAPQQQQQQQGYRPPQLYNQPTPHMQPPPVYPSAPQQPAYQTPAPAKPPPQQQQQQWLGGAGGSSNGAGRGSSSSSSSPANGGRDWWSKPLKLLDSAVHKVDSAVQSIASELGGNSCDGCGRAIGLGPTLRALGKQWHVGCFRWVAALCCAVLSPSLWAYQRHLGAAIKQLAACCRVMCLS
jgi:hypothetical protein